MFPTDSSFAEHNCCCPSPPIPTVAAGYPNEANEFPFAGEQKDDDDESAASAFGWMERVGMKSYTVTLVVCELS